MVLHIVGTGLNGYYSLTISGLETLKLCDKIYILKGNNSIYKTFTDNGFSLDFVNEGDLILADSEFYCISLKEPVAILFEGDFNYKNYYLLKMKMITEEKGINVKIIHNSSLFNAVGCSGLQLYRFGQSFEIKHYLTKESSPAILKKIVINMKKKLHTFIHYDSTYTSSSSHTIHFFENLLNHSNFEKNEYISEITPCIALSVSDDKKIRVESLTIEALIDSANKLARFAFVICSDLHPVEEEALIKLVSSWKQPRLDVSSHTFHLIGLGLGSPMDITLAGKTVVVGSEKVYLEGYTSTMIGGKTALQEYYGKKIDVADREITEEKSDEIIDHLHHGDVSFLVVGDPLGATTHIDLLIRVMDANYSVNVINNASIINASCVCGLLPENFGEIVSIPFWEDDWKPDSFVEKICSNLESCWHTLCLLDIKVKEVSLENLARGKKKYEPPRFMSVSHAAKQLLSIIADKIEPILLESNTKVMGLARIGTESEQIVECSLQEMSAKDLGEPLHSLIIVSNDRIESAVTPVY